MTIPGDAHFAIDVKQWLPTASEEEIEKVSYSVCISLLISVGKTS